MSYGQLGNNAIPDRICVEYAPTGRASCKTCGSAIAQDAVRLGEKVRSPWHDGFDIKWHHATVRCGLRHAAKSVHEIKGFQRLRWADQLAIATALRPELAEATQPPEVKRLNELMWQVKEKLEKLPKPAMRELIEANGVYVSDKATGPAMLHGIADGLVCGKLPVCPWCAGRSLELEGTLLRCYGYQQGSTHCTYKAAVGPDIFGGPSAPTKADAAVVAREGRWALTPTVERALKGWAIPPDAPVHKLAGGGGGGGGVDGGGGGGGAKGSKKKKRAAAATASDEAPSEDEEVGSGEEMAGMSFACIGSVNPPAAEIAEIVQAHGGTFVTGGIGDGSVITHLIATEAEARKPAGKRSTKFAAAFDGGVPIVSVDYVLALAGELPPEELEASSPAAGGGKRVRAAAGGLSAAEAIRLDSDDDDEEEAVTDDLDDLKVPELRERCAAYNVSSSGKKAALIARIREAAAAAGGGVTTAEPPPPKKRKSAAGAAEASGSDRGTPLIGAALRQRKHMAKYLLAGELGGKMPSVSSVLATRSSMAAAAAAKAPPPRRMLPEITPNSALLTVDGEAEMGGARIYVDEYNLAYNCTLNQMDIRTGVNKYYKMQLLVSGKKGSRYTVFKSWGRVGGEEGASAGGDHWSSGRVNNSLKHAHESHLDSAVKEFHDKFRELACQPFESCEPPCQAKGGYNVNLIPGQVGKDVTAAARVAAAKKAQAESAAQAAQCEPSTLPSPVQQFVELIFSERMMQQQLEALSIDLEKMPLGSISDKQAERGYAILCDIASALKDPMADPNAHAERLLGLTNAFYNTIPHKFGVKQTPPVITTRELLLQKIEAIESLLQVSAAQSLAGSLESESGGGPRRSTHPTDANYAKLKCGLQPASAEEVAMVEKCAKETHAATHSSYTLKVKHVFRADREGEAAAFKKGEAIGNRMLLWHGSRLTNWVGILSQGLRIAPPEAPATGYMFGKGLYFADMVSKSANYCFASRDSPTGVLLLCDVALGEQHELIANQYEAAEKSKARGKHSTWGVGKTCPDPAGQLCIPPGVSVPSGKGVPSQYLADNLDRIKSEGGGGRSELLYNEFIVYDTKQVRTQYVVVVDFEFL